MLNSENYMKTINELPKIELHCHLDGSVRPETILDLAKKDNLSLEATNLKELSNLLVAPMDCTSLDEYLKRFELPLKLMQTKENLERISYELMQDYFLENTKYVEIRFGPLLHKEKGLTCKEIISSVISGIKKAEKEMDIRGNLILSCLRNMPIDSMYEIIDSGKEFLNNGVVAIDLCSSELEGFCSDFIKPISYARSLGYNVTIHAGETGFGQNVLDAIKLLGATRIGHGVAINSHEKAFKCVKENNVLLEMCPTSNVQTKAVDSFENHPIKPFLQNNIKVSINTDNRTVSNTNLNNEYEICQNVLNLSHEDFKKYI